MWNIIKKLFGMKDQSTKVEFKLMENSSFTASSLTESFESEKERNSYRK